MIAAHLRDSVRSKMVLTAELVERCERPEPDPGPRPDFIPIEPMELEALAEKLLFELGNETLWLFAYGSLIWKPDFSFVEQRRGTIHGWNRSFCIELKSWRGTPQFPGLMLALDHGGRCNGIVYQLPDGEHREHIRRLVRREMLQRKTLQWRAGSSFTPHQGRSVHLSSGQAPKAKALP